MQVTGGRSHRKQCTRDSTEPEQWLSLNSLLGTNITDRYPCMGTCLQVCEHADECKHEHMHLVYDCMSASICEQRFIMKRHLACWHALPDNKYVLLLIVDYIPFVIHS